jgi:hypothetical protein
MERWHCNDRRAPCQRSVLVNIMVPFQLFGISEQMAGVESEILIDRNLLFSIFYHA